MEEQEKQAWITALRMLTAAPKAKKELGRRLEEKGYSRNAVDQVLNELEKRGLLNDSAYAQALFQSYTLSRPRGRKRIAFDMEKKGVPASLITELMNQYPMSTEKEQAAELARNRWERFKKIPVRQRRKKIYDFLVRKGFDYNLSREVAAQLGAT